MHNNSNNNKLHNIWIKIIIITIICKQLHTFKYLYLFNYDNTNKVKKCSGDDLDMVEKEKPEKRNWIFFS